MSYTGLPAHSDISIHAPRMGSDSHVNVFLLVRRISIHAPAWGATDIRGTDKPTGHISIHAPAWGATTPAR